MAEGPSDSDAAEWASADYAVDQAGGDAMIQRQAPWWQRTGSASNGAPSALIEPDILNRAQWDDIHGGRPEEPLRSLYQALVFQALQEIRKYQHQRTPHGERTVAEAVAWIEDIDGENVPEGQPYPVTFHEAIDRGFVGVDAEVISKAILKRTGALPRSRGAMRCYFAARGYRSSSLGQSQNSRRTNEASRASRPNRGVLAHASTRLDGEAV